MNKKIKIIILPTMIILFSSIIVYLIGNSFESNQEIWIEKEVTQCSNSWDSYVRDWRKDNDSTVLNRDDYKVVLLTALRDFYRDQNIPILDIQIQDRYKGNIYCEACGCSAGHTVMLLINRLDLIRMQELGFIVSVSPES